MRLRALLPVLVVLGMLLACSSPSATPAVFQPTLAPQAVETPSPAPPTATPQPVVLRIGAADDSYNNDPKKPGDANLGMYPVNVNIFESLTRLDERFELQPLLAERWEYNAETNTWRFFLRKDVKFHNGAPLTSADVVKTINTLGTGMAAGLLHINDKSATAVDEHTVDIVCTVPNGQLPGQLAHPSYGIRQKDSDPFADEHVGTGPFRFVSYTKGEALIVERNTEYWGKPAAAERIEFRFLPDPVARVMGLRSGDLDVILDPPFEQAAQIEKDPDLQLLTAGAGSIQTLDVMSNAQNKEYDLLLQDIRLREAIGYAIDRKAIAQQVFFGLVEEKQSYLPPEMLRGHESLIMGYTYDPDRARQLLSAAGWEDSNGDGVREKGGIPLELTLVNGFPSAAQNGASAELIQSHLKAVGIKVNLVTAPDRPTAFDLLAKQQWHLLLSTFSQNSGSPCFLPGFMYWGRWPKPGDWPKAFAPRNYDTALGDRYDDQIARCNAAATQDAAAQAAATALHLIIDESRTVFPVAGIRRAYAARGEIAGVMPHPVPVMMRWDTATRR
ncbi:MAG: ABC transporter substrate-binding protein [Anaerolineae bacterium]